MIFKFFNGRFIADLHAAYRILDGFLFMRMSFHSDVPRDVYDSHMNRGRNLAHVLHA